MRLLKWNIRYVYINTILFLAWRSETIVISFFPEKSLWSGLWCNISFKPYFAIHRSPLLLLVEWRLINFISGTKNPSNSLVMMAILNFLYWSVRFEKYFIMLWRHKYRWLFICLYLIWCQCSTSNMLDTNLFLINCPPWIKFTTT